MMAGLRHELSPPGNGDKTPQVGRGEWIVVGNGVWRSGVAEALPNLFQPGP